MNKIESSSNPNAGGNTPDNARPHHSTQGEGTHKQTRSQPTRSHAPQFGTDRRGPRDSDNSRLKSTHQYAQNPADPGGPPQNSGSAPREPERRKARTDRRQSVSQRS